MAKRKNTVTFETPVVVFYPEKGFGWEVAAGISVNTKVDDVYARFGVYVPLAVDDKTTVTIEPLLKVNKINDSSKTLFRDMLSFGFLVSVSIPKFISE